MSGKVRDYIKKHWKTVKKHRLVWIADRPKGSHQILTNKKTSAHSSGNSVVIEPSSMKDCVSKSAPIFSKIIQEGIESGSDYTTNFILRK